MSLRTHFKQPIAERLGACFCSLLLLIVQLIPVQAAPTGKLVQESSNRKQTAPVKAFPLLTADRLPSTPSDLEIEFCTVFSGPLVPMTGPISPGENQALAAALKEFDSDSSHTDISSLTGFIAKYPSSRWRAALELNVGAERFGCGYFSESLALWESAWNLSKNEQDSKRKAIADQAVSLLVLLQARLGRMKELERTLASIEGRAFFGGDEARISAAKDGLTAMEHYPETSFMCGPYALDNVLRSSNLELSEKLRQAKCSPNGTNLHQLAKLAQSTKWHALAAHRSPGAAILVPSVVHWKVDHFSAILKQQGEAFLVDDPTFGRAGKRWISRDVIDNESDGCFLVDASSLPDGWRRLTDEEAGKVWGRGTAHYIDGSPRTGYCPRYNLLSEPSTPPIGPDSVSPDSCPWTGSFMPVANVFPMQASLNFVDVPLSYPTPVGLPMRFGLNYNYQEEDWTGTGSFGTTAPQDFTLSHDWSFAFKSYVKLSTNTTFLNDAVVFVRGGGSEYYDADTFNFPQQWVYPSRDLTSQAKLTAIPHNSAPSQPTTFERTTPDGTLETYSRPTGTPTNRWYLTSIRDPLGNIVNIAYDASGRISQINDLVSRATSITYSSTNPSDAGYWKIATITDPFGRSCSFQYDAGFNKLTSITDSIGLTTSFIYRSSSEFIEIMRTPYGDTIFDDAYALGWSGPSGHGQNDPMRRLKVTFPDGSATRVENWTGLGVATTYIWSRQGEPDYPTITNKATVIKWQVKSGSGLQTNSNMEAPVISSIKPPLDAQTSYTYPGETSAGQGFFFVGTLNKPITISRSGQTETWQYTYNSAGLPLSAIDPVGRTFNFDYSPSNSTGIDLKAVRQVRGGDNDYVAQFTYDPSRPNLHVPISAVDSSGNTTTFAYNSFGQLNQVTDASGNVWSLGYSGAAGTASAIYLTSITAPLAGGQAVTTISRDSVGRIGSITYADGYVVTYNYDDGDRLTKTTYPDGSFEQIVYDRLDAVAFRDRQGRWSQAAFDEMDQLSYTIDPEGRKTAFDWCTCGSLAELRDQAGNVTKWHHDVQGRVIEKTYPDCKTELMEYDSFGRLFRKDDSSSPTRQRTNITFFPDDTVDDITYSFLKVANSTPSVSFMYDTRYKRAISVDTTYGASTSTLTYGYNPLITSDLTQTSKKYLWAGGSPQANDTVTLTFANSALAGGQYTMPAVTVTATEAGDPTKVAALIGSAVVANTTLATAGISATPTTAAANKTMVTFTASNGQSLSVDAATSGSTTVTRGGGGRLWNVTNSSPVSSISYSYDEQSRLAYRTTNGAANFIKPNYDAVSRITSITDSLGTFNFSYLDASKGLARLSSIDYPASVLTTSLSWLGNTLDDRLQSISNSNSSGVLSRFDQTHSPVGNVVQWRQTQDAQSALHIFEYDDTDQMVTAQVASGAATSLVIGGDATTGDDVAVTFVDENLGGGSITITHQVQPGETLQDVAQQLRDAINDPGSGLSAANISASWSSNRNQTVQINSTSSRATIISAKTSRTGGAATVSAFLAPATAIEPFSDQLYYFYDCARNRIGAQRTSGSGIGTSTDITQWTANSLNQLATKSAGGRARFRGSANKAITSVVVNGVSATRPDSRAFVADAPLTVSSASSASVTANDARNSSETENFEVNVTGPSSATYQYDENGNMTFDGANTFEWDAENRLRKITYPSSAGTSTFDYDGFGRCVRITELTTAGTMTKEFTWDGTIRCEEKDTSGTDVTVKRFFNFGEQILDPLSVSTNYLFTSDHLGSVREVADTTGALVAQYSYTPFGERTKITGSGPDADFGFAGMYHHARSGLNLTLFRAYDSRLARWLSRDPLGESMGTNLYAYVGNNPVVFIDPLGLYATLGEAGLVGTQVARTLTGITGTEVGGLIYRDPFGYHITPPVIADQGRQVDVNEARKYLENCPNAEVVGDYHSHTALAPTGRMFDYSLTATLGKKFYGTGIRVPDAVTRFVGTAFSQADISGAVEDYRQSFLGGRTGQSWMFPGQNYRSGMFGYVPQIGGQYIPGTTFP
jgi:RHS repeat-associated protein